MASDKLQGIHVIIVTTSFSKRSVGQYAFYPLAKTKETAFLCRRKA